VAICSDEQKLPEVRVRATCQQTAKQLAWALHDRLCTLAAGSSARSLPDPPNLRHLHLRRHVESARPEIPESTS